MYVQKYVCIVLLYNITVHTYVYTVYTYNIIPKGSLNRFTCTRYLLSEPRHTEPSFISRMSFKAVRFSIIYASYIYTYKNSYVYSYVYSSRS